MNVKIRRFRFAKPGLKIRELTMIAKFTAELTDFSISQVKLMDCPDRGIIVWPPTDVRISKLLRKALTNAAIKEMDAKAVSAPEEA